MQEQAECEIDLEENGNRITIRNLSIDDRDVVSYLNDTEPDKRCSALLQALKIGAMASTSIDAETNLKYVQESFERLSERMKYELDSVFDPATGKMSLLLQSRLDENDSVVSELLDPNKDGTPLHLLRKHLDEELRKIHDKLVARAAADEATKKTARKGTQKGRKFEDWCEDILAEMAEVLADKMERTGDVTGRASATSKNGDFVITVNGLESNRNRIVFEMKSGDTKTTHTKIEEDVQSALKNRQAQYCIFVSKYKEPIPSDVGWFNEYDGKYLVCALGSNDPESDTSNENEAEYVPSAILQIAYKWARTRLQASTVHDNEIDNTFLVGKISYIQSQIQRLDGISKNCGTIEKANNGNIKLAGEIKNEIDSEINMVLSKLKS